MRVEPDVDDEYEPLEDEGLVIEVWTGQGSIRSRVAALLSEDVCVLCGRTMRLLGLLALLLLAGNLVAVVGLCLRPRISAEEIFEIEERARLRLAQEQQIIRALKER